MATDEMAYKLWTKAFARTIKCVMSTINVLINAELYYSFFRGFDDLTGKEHLLAATQTSATKYVSLTFDYEFRMCVYLLHLFYVLLAFSVPGRSLIKVENIVEASNITQGNMT